MSLSTTNLGTRNVGLSEGYEFHECGICNVTWGMTEAFIASRRDDHKSWYCPNGHSWHFSGPSVEEELRTKLKRERETLARRTAELDQTEASLRATKGHVTRQRRKLERVSKGVCPCCNRSFQDLKRHMKSQHPDYVGG